MKPPQANLRNATTLGKIFGEPEFEPLAATFFDTLRLCWCFHQQKHHKHFPPNSSPPTLSLFLGPFPVGLSQNFLSFWHLLLSCGHRPIAFWHHTQYRP